MTAGGEMWVCDSITQKLSAVRQYKCKMLLKVFVDFYNMSALGIWN